MTNVIPPPNPLVALTATVGRLAAAASTLGVAVVIAIGLSAITPLLGTNALSLSAQCYVCDVGSCKDGGGGSSCTTHHEGGSQTCATDGGRVCQDHEEVLARWPDMHASSSQRGGRNARRQVFGRPQVRDL